MPELLRGKKGILLSGGVMSLVLVGLPFVFSSGFSINLMSQIGIWIILCLAYNMLFGQTGMLSFGHAVFSGLGAFFVVHALNWVGTGRLNIPVVLMPLVGGAAGACFGIALGYLMTRRSGVAFAMITMGLAEMIYLSTSIFPQFFGGEGGVTTNRVVGPAFLGITFGSAIQVYYLVAAWCVASVMLMYAFTTTPLGKISNAVRENSERAEFVGYDSKQVVYLVLIISAFFSGIAGGLSAITFEIASGDNLHMFRSANILLAAFIGGAHSFFGPAFGAVIYMIFSVVLSDHTKAWQLYLGVFFILMVLYAPSGLSGIVSANLRVIRSGSIGALKIPYLYLVTSAIPLCAGIFLIVEMLYHRLLEVGSESKITLAGLQWDSSNPTAWVVQVLILTAGLALFEMARRHFMRVWHLVQGEMDAKSAQGNEDHDDRR